MGITKNEDSLSGATVKGSYQVLLTADTVAMLEGIEPWIYISQLRRHPLDTWFCTNVETSNSQAREVADIQVDQILPRQWIKTSYFG